MSSGSSASRRSAAVAVAAVAAGVQVGDGAPQHRPARRAGSDHGASQIGSSMRARNAAWAASSASVGTIGRGARMPAAR